MVNAFLAERPCRIGERPSDKTLLRMIPQLSRGL